MAYGPYGVASARRPPKRTACIPMVCRLDLQNELACVPGCGSQVVSQQQRIDALSTRIVWTCLKQMFGWTMDQSGIDSPTLLRLKTCTGLSTRFSLVGRGENECLQTGNGQPLSKRR